MCPFPEGKLQILGQCGYGKTTRLISVIIGDVLVVEKRYGY
jgi:hypothetical protein